MTVFDLLFLAIVLASLVTLITAGVAALRGKRKNALRILGKLGVGALIYVSIVVAVGLAAPQRILHAGNPWCFDDWCLSMERVTHTAAPPRIAYTVSLRLFSRARRVSQRAKFAWVYLIDRQGNRYAPEPDTSAVPLDVLLRPGESVTTSRVFNVPADAGELGLITGHGGPCCFPNLIIGDEASLLHKRTLIRLE